VSVSSPPRRALDDLTTFRNYIGSPAVLPFIDAPWVPFFVFIIFTMHAWLGILAMASVVVLVGLSLLNDRTTQAQLRRAAERQAMANDFAGQIVQNAEVVRAMGMRDAIQRRYRAFIDQQGEASQLASDRAAIYQSMTKAIRIAVQSATLGLGALLVIRGELTPGGMIAASIILGRALAPVEQGIGSWKQFVGARDAYRSLKEFLGEIPAAEERISLPGLRGSVRVEDVTYRVGEGDAPILRRISFALEPGTAMALVGPSASGKSTLCRLLVGSIAPTLGTVRIDNADVTALKSEDVQRLIGYLPQNVELFAGTVKENVARLGSVDDAAVVEAAKAAGCHETILRLPRGYETEIGPRGAFLSGGQRQRIGLARALYGGPRVLVLDEPNSNLDQEGEVALIQAIVNAKQAGVTVIVVNHRSTLLQPIDKLGLIRDGVLELFGDRDDVLRQMMPPRAAPKPTLVQTGGT
jgi:PrtD family type I secretion system ABC transporter